MLPARLLLLVVMATAANADVFNITFNPVADLNFFGGGLQRYFFTGTIVTDGVCSLCAISQSSDGTITSDGIISIVIGPTDMELGTPRSLDLVDGGTVSLDVTNGVLSGVITRVGIDYTIEFGETITSCIYNEPCLKGPNAYDWGAEGLATEWGTYTISSAPEPSSWFMLAAIAVPMVLRRRRRFPAFVLTVMRVFIADRQTVGRARIPSLR